MNTPVDEKFESEVQNAIEGLQKVFGKAFDNIQPDKRSIEYLDGYIERNKHDMTESQKRSLAIGIGLLLGEAMIKEYGGKWVFREGNESDPVIIIGNDEIMCFPIQKTFKQFNEVLEHDFLREESILNHFSSGEAVLMIARKQFDEKATAKNFGIKTITIPKK